MVIRPALILLGAGLLSSVAFPGTAADISEYRQWIEAMKTHPRGPFKEIRWYCNDGSILPPEEYACVERGGGHQHGAWNEQTTTLRNAGYKIANLLAGFDPELELEQPDFLDSYNQLLIEKFLVAADAGWILRRALYYRGAIQEQDERKGARELLIALSAQPEWIGLRYSALRIGADLLPHGRDTASVWKVRQLSSSLADEDPDFIELRGKIHGTPSAEDAGLVRDYAAVVNDPELKEKYAELAREIDHIYLTMPLPRKLQREAQVFTRGPWLQALLRNAARSLADDASALHQYQTTARLLADLRGALPRIMKPVARLRVLDLSLVVETENFTAGSLLRQQLTQASREERIAWLTAAVTAAYGTGTINQRGYRELRKILDTLDQPTLPMADYMQSLGDLARVPGWATQGLRFQFYAAMQKLAEIEPLALRFIQDQLRGSPLLFYSVVLNSLLQDAYRSAGVRHRLFGEDIGVGFRALNPGLARGVLHVSSGLDAHAGFSSEGIYLLPETIAELPPVAGILTAGEGNPLSHVQLLARNLGIPNVGVDADLLDAIRAHDGQRVVLAVSPGGLVELAPDGPQWDAEFGEVTIDRGAVIRSDLEKLDLSVTDFLALDRLRASDSGRVVGPKAAKLGELRHAFAESVAPALAIPFGVFRETVLDKPYGDSDSTVFAWMVEQYRHMQSLPADSVVRREFTERFRAELHALILSAELDDDFRTRLHESMVDAFGSADEIGVFVRSDTNVEDLTGFTGAGLNLTVPNVVGFENVLAAIPRVWASPFTKRAFAWRQAHMETPEHVYPSILLMQSVPNDKSGVMVTRDLDSGAPQILSVAVNEGVGGAVEGQSAESLRIDTRDGSVRLLAMATTPWRRNPAPDGGIEKVPASGSDTILQPAEIRRLISFAGELPRRFPSIVDEAGEPVPADVEFGFVDGKLQLFQIRPFLDSRLARGSRYLKRMDATLGATLSKTVDLREVPQ